VSQSHGGSEETARLALEVVGHPSVALAAVRALTGHETSADVP
jgi:hypothetical protein